MADTVDPELVERLVLGVLAALGHGGGPARPDLPVYISDKEAMAEFYGRCSRGHYYGVLARDPRFPESVQVGGRLRVRRTADHLRFMAERKASPVPPEPEAVPVRRRRRGITA